MTLNESNYYNSYDNNYYYQVDKKNNLYIDDDIDKEDELIPNEDIYYINKPYQPNNKVSNQIKSNKTKNKNEDEGEEDFSSFVSTITELVKSVNQMQVQLDKYIDTSNQKIISMTERISIIERKYEDISSENYILKNEIFMLKKKD